MQRTRSAIMASVLLLQAVMFAAGNADESLLEETRRSINIQSPDSPSFVLEADVTLQMDVAVNGHYTWRWAGRELWSQETTAGDYHQVVLMKEGMLYTRRNSNFTPLRFSELQDLLSMFNIQDRQWEIRKIRDQEENGAKLRCFELRRKENGPWKPERLLCIDLATMDIASDEMRYAQEFRRKEFSGY